MELKFDREKYAAVVVDKDGNPYAFEREKNPKFLEADDNYVFECYQIRSDGTLNTHFSIPIKRSDLDDRFVRVG